MQSSQNIDLVFALHHEILDFLSLFQIVKVNIAGSNAFIEAITKGRSANIADGLSVPINSFMTV